MLQLGELGMGKLRVSFAAKNGLPKVPGSVRVSTSLHGDTEINREPEIVATVMFPLTPEMEGTKGSETVIVCVPVVASVTENVPVPFRVVSAGRVAEGSLLVKCTGFEKAGTG